MKEAFSYACWTAKTIRCGGGAWDWKLRRTRISMDSSHASSRSRPSPEATDAGTGMDGFAGRLAWRPSHWLPASLCLLAIAAVAAAWLSALPQPTCMVLSVLVPAYAGWLIVRERKRPACVLVPSEHEAGWNVESQGRVESLRQVGASFRGRLVVLTLADDDGRRRRFVWWPDTLDAAGRRTLRLAGKAVRSHGPAGAGA
jgi:toxin CptA